jgi:acetyl/propionyl-CoA carboxylase alpha subunit
MADTHTLLIANRGEIAVRIIRTAQALGLTAVAVRSADEEALGDAAGLHVQLADRVVTLPGRGAAAYLDAEAVVAAAQQAGAQLVHPGYGFLAESARLAQLVAEAGLTWVGPSPAALELFGDKRATRQRAVELGIPVPAATQLLSGEGGSALAAVRQLLSEHPDGIAIKAVAGGGGRGIRLVADPSELERALTACAAEARAGFGDDRVFAEALVTGARHIEVQVLGTREGVVVLGDRDCSIQRRRQKLVEIAPAPHLSDDLRARLHADAARLCASVGYASLATVEFLVTGEDHVLLEVNPRIQVEHTVTEEVTGLDLVALQLAVASGESSAPLVPQPRGYAVQLRVSAETLGDTGDPAPSVGEATAVRWPTGPGVRVDTWVEAGTRVTGSFDALLGKVIVQGPTLDAALRAGERALRETSISGVDTTVGLLRAIGETLEPGQEPTTAFDTRAHEIVTRAREIDADARAARGDAGAGGAGTTGDGSADNDGTTGAAAAAGAAASGAVTPGGQAAGAAAASAEPALAPGEELLRAPLTGTVIGLGEDPREYVLLEAMKMHHPVAGPAAGRVRHLVAVGASVPAGTPLAVLSQVTGEDAGDAAAHEPHPGVAEVQERHAAVLDDAREDQLERIRARGRRTARENIADLVDPCSFVEYGPLVIAAQTQRRSVEDLIRRTSGDGLLGGTATVEGREVVVLSYDYSVLAGTQGTRNHHKTDRLIQLAERRGVPLVLFAEGGGGRPGDTDRAPSIGLGVETFGSLARLRGRVPLVSVVSGRTFAGNAALAGVCDLIIATPEVNLGMGGPAMIEGGGLGRHRPEDIGPAAVHLANGNIDILAEDEADAVAHVKEALSVLTGTARAGETPVTSGDGVEGASADAVDTSLAEAARTAVPADRLRAFAMRQAIEAVVDPGSFTEVRHDFGAGAITGFGRVDGRPFALIANDNHHLGGAIDVDAARTMTHHLRLAHDHGVPVVSFVDTPGFIVGPEAEHEPGVRAFGDLFVAGASLTVPFGAVVIRKGYGLGAMAMMAGSAGAPQFTVAWPSGEMGPMGLEGAVRLGYAKELAAIEDEAERAAEESRLVDELYAQGRAMNAAMLFEIDDVIDPALTREWIRTLM